MGSSALLEQHDSETVPTGFVGTVEEM